MARFSSVSLPSIRDVAEGASVSPATVSRAFSAPDLLREETLQRVLAVAQELGYHPKRAPRGTIRGQTYRISVVVPDLGNPFFPAILKGVQKKAREAGYAVFLADADENPRLEAELIRAMVNQVDGIVICSSRLTKSELQQFIPATKLVLLNRRIRGVSTVLFDSAGGMRQAIEHLAALGHRRVAFLSGPSNSWSNQERRRGLSAAARTLGIEVVELGPFAPRFEAGQQAADLALAEKVTAIVAYNDLMALGVLSRFADRGVAVPEEVSVVGFDNIAMAAMATPHLTTVALPLEMAGRVAIELLLDQLDRTEAVAAAEQTLGAQLIVRASTAPPGDVSALAPVHTRRTVIASVGAADSGAGS